MAYLPDVLLAGCAAVSSYLLALARMSVVLTAKSATCRAEARQHRGDPFGVPAQKDTSYTVDVSDHIFHYASIIALHSRGCVYRHKQCSSCL